MKRASNDGMEYVDEKIMVMGKGLIRSTVMMKRAMMEWNVNER